MGKMLGAYASDELDRPDLNKCPDCGCFFATENCPLCGKLCPEEMRAGNRKKVKIKKHRSQGDGRVRFIEWYHSWWFIVIMLFAFPIVGICLLITSPYKKTVKAVIIIAAAAWIIVSSFGIIGKIQSIFEHPVDTSLSKEEYVSLCEEISVEEFFRNPDKYNEKFVKLELTVTQKITDSEKYYNNEKYTTYYICKSQNGFTILLRDCSQDGIKNFIAGDQVTVYGEGTGNITVYYDEYNSCSAPCVNGAYIVLNTK